MRISVWVVIRNGKIAHNEYGMLDSYDTEERAQAEANRSNAWWRSSESTVKPAWLEVEG